MRKLLVVSGKKQHFKLKHVYKVIQEITCAEPTFEIMKLAPLEDSENPENKASCLILSIP